MTNNSVKNKFRGCLVGGAAGDALGYAVEFVSEKTIFGEYGKNGITEYSLSHKNGKAIISDDTQMTIFTAGGLIDYFKKPQDNSPMRAVAEAYMEWLLTQEVYFDEAEGYLGNFDNAYSLPKLMSVPELYKRRAPGITCLSALRSRRERGDLGAESYLKSKLNNSKGCGGVMRVAPVGLISGMSVEETDLLAAEAAAYTHCHSLGYMPAAVLADVVRRCVYNERGLTLKEIVTEARDTVGRIFADDKNIRELTDFIDLAIELSENDRADLDNIHRLGEGWVGDEALYISLYCCLRHPDDFSAAVIASVNHKGDSDSTGAITGNILGAMLGLDAIEEKWKTKLELYPLLIDVADELYNLTNQ